MRTRFIRHLVSGMAALALVLGLNVTAAPSAEAVTASCKTQTFKSNVSSLYGTIGWVSVKYKWCWNSRGKITSATLLDESSGVTAWGAVRLYGITGHAQYPQTELGNMNYTLLNKWKITQGVPGTSIGRHIGYASFRIILGVNAASSNISLTK